MLRNLADIIADDRKGKQLSQTERQIAVAYAQGKYDAVRELNLIGNSSNINEILDKIKAEIEGVVQRVTVFDCSGGEYESIELDPDDVFEIIDKHKTKRKE